MIEKKIRKGQYLDFGNIGATQSQPAGTGQVSIGTADRQISDSSKEHFYSATYRAVSDGSNLVKENRNFKWLPWADNAINYIESQGSDVLSGPFSGCHMVVYNYNGARRIGHIATPGAKNAWNSLVANDPLIEVLAGFKPDVGYVDEIAKDNDSGLNIFGLVTAESGLYCIISFVQNFKPESRIAAKKRMDSLSVEVLSNLP